MWLVFVGPDSASDGNPPERAKKGLNEPRDGGESTNLWGKAGLTFVFRRIVRSS